MRDLFHLISVFLFAPIFFVNSAEAIIVYGQSNEDSAVKYDSSTTAAEASVVSINSASAVYLGGGWFITANHVGITTSMYVTQNGTSAKVSYVDSSLNSNYGVDLKMFYVSDLSSLEGTLKSIAVSSTVCDSIKGGTFSSRYSPLTGYSLVYNDGTQVSIVGAGSGRSDSSGLFDSTVESNGVQGTVYSGSGTIYSSTKDASGNDIFATMAVTDVGIAQAQRGDSGSGMFVEYNGQWYLIGVNTNVTQSPDAANFGDYSYAVLKYGEDGKPSGVDTSAFEDFSMTVSQNLSKYADDINLIIASVPQIPEPMSYAVLISFISFAFAVWRRR